MKIDMEELCHELNNWFMRDFSSGIYTIQDGKIDLSHLLLDGQYYRIVKSTFNDGVHKYGDDSDQLIDETFAGQIWAMAVPPAVIDLLKEINEWLEKYSNVIYSPFSSENVVGVYSYTKAPAGGGELAGSSEAGKTGGWQNVFAGKMNKWRKI